MVVHIFFSKTNLAPHRKKIKNQFNGIKSTMTDELRKKIKGKHIQDLVIQQKPSNQTPQEAVRWTLENQDRIGTEAEKLTEASMKRAEFTGLSPELITSSFEQKEAKLKELVDIQSGLIPGISAQARQDAYVESVHLSLEVAGLRKQKAQTSPEIQANKEKVDKMKADRLQTVKEGEEAALAKRQPAIDAVADFKKEQAQRKDYHAANQVKIDELRSAEPKGDIVKQEVIK